MRLRTIPSLGIMQGRLLPKYKGRYQAHPVNFWQNEFGIAAEIGLDYIEFILDFEDVEANPLMSRSGIDDIKTQTEKSGVQVKSVCADYFMEAPLHSPDENVKNRSLKILDRLMENAGKLGVLDIVIPCVDQSTLHSEEDRLRLIDALGMAIPKAEALGIHLALETDLDPKAFAALLSQLPSTAVSVNYDSGNSASLGYSVEEEFAAYGSRITDLHIKDRQKGGGSVELGTGDTDFAALFREMDKIQYSGLVVMQVYRDDEGVEIFKKQLNRLKEIDK